MVSIDGGDDDLNQAAYLQLKDKIDTTYPKDRFVAIHGGRIVADAESFEAMLDRLQQLGVKSPEAMVVRAGDDSSDYIDIL